MKAKPENAAKILKWKSSRSKMPHGEMKKLHTQRVSVDYSWALGASDFLDFLPWNLSFEVHPGDKDQITTHKASGTKDGTSVEQRLKVLLLF